MIIEFDAEVDSLYLRIGAGDVARTVELCDEIHLDVDANGHVLGAEFIYASEFFAVLLRNDGRFEIPGHIDLENSIG